METLQEMGIKDLESVVLKAHDDAPDVLAGMVEKFRNNANRIDLKRISAMV